jgi:hypothetical protein
MLNGKRSGSNNLMNSLHHLIRTKMVWMDSPPDIWKTFGLSFSNDEFYLNPNISNCFDEIFQSNSGTKLNWDEPGYLDIVDEILDYPVLKILTYRKNIFEKVISEMLAIQTGHWIGPVGVHKQYKRDYKFDKLNYDEVKSWMETIHHDTLFMLEKVNGREDVKVFSYEDLFDRNIYTDRHRQNYFSLVMFLNIEKTEKEIDDKRAEFLEPRQCYKTDQTYQNIENFSELEKLKDYLLL